MQSPTSPIPAKNAAFSLLELSIVVIIIGIMLASVLPAITQKKVIKNQQELQTKMQAIEHALRQFRLLHHRLPCPAQAGLNTESANFGVQAATPGTCTGGTPAATSPLANTVVGLVPTRTLGLADDMAFDPWGRAFTYMVDVRITEDTPAGYLTYAVDDATIGTITISNRDVVTDTLSTITSNALAVVVSHGENGHGGYLPSGSRFTGSAANADELENCNCDADADPGTDNASFVIADEITNEFDDIVRYYTRGSFLTDEE